MPLRTRFNLVSGESLHIEAARVALVNWLTARRAGGRFLLRVVDGAREDDVERAVEDLRWLGVDWDEGLQRLDGAARGYEGYYRQLIESGAAYLAFETAEDLERMRREAAAAWRVFRYRRPGRVATAEEAERARRAGRPVVLRLKMPGRDITIDDQVLGPVTIAAEELDDFVIREADGRASRLLREVVADEVAGVTHVIRGQKDLPWAHRQAALREALGFGLPTYAHLPLILENDGGLLRRRVDVRDFRVAGYLPEVVLSFVAHLGWSPAWRSEPLSRDEMVRLFDVRQISRTAARFDGRRLLEQNARRMAAAGQERLLAGLADYVSTSDTPLKGVGAASLPKLLRLTAGSATFGEVEEKCRALFVADEQVVYDGRAVRKVLARGEPGGFEVLGVVRAQMAGLTTWDATHLEALAGRIGEQLGVTLPRVAQVIRVAVSGRAGNLPIGLLLEILGQARTQRRMARCLALAEADRY